MLLESENKQLFHSVAKGICDGLQIHLRQFDSDHYVQILCIGNLL